MLKKFIAAAERKDLDYILTLIQAYQDQENEINLKKIFLSDIDHELIDFFSKEHKSYSRQTLEKLHDVFEELKAVPETRIISGAHYYYLKILQQELPSKAEFGKFNSFADWFLDEYRPSVRHRPFANESFS